MHTISHHFTLLVSPYHRTQTAFVRHISNISWQSGTILTPQVNFENAFQIFVSHRTTTGVTPLNAKFWFWQGYFLMVQLQWCIDIYRKIKWEREMKKNKLLDPVGSTVGYDIMKLCTGSEWYSNGCYLVLLSQYKVVMVNS